MDVFEAIKSRRSIRKYSQAPIEPGLLEKMVDAARWAPSGSNAQKWEFVVLTDKPTIELVRKTSPGLFSSPPALIVICSRRPASASYWQKYILACDCAMAAQNLMLAAQALGLGTCVALSFSNIALKELLEIPDGVEPELVVTVGHAAENAAPPKRREISEIMHSNKYGRRES